MRSLSTKYGAENITPTNWRDTRQQKPKKKKHKHNSVEFWDEMKKIFGCNDWRGLLFYANGNKIFAGYKFLAIEC